MNLEAGLRAVAPSLPTGIAAVLQETEPALIAMTVNTPRRWAALLGQTAHESGAYTRRVENLWYTAPRLRAVWPSHFPSLTFARKYEKNPEKLANYIYGVKLAERLGNLAPEDGFRFRGRGWIQITGRSNYTRAAQALNVDLVGNPALAEDPATAFLIAGWFLKVHKRHSKTALEWAEFGNTEMVTRIINGGVHGLEDRRQKTARALRALMDSSSSLSGTLSTGDTGEAVVVLQEMLARLGYSPGPIDGWFGGKTETAIRAFQADQSLTVDGKVGSATWAALANAAASL